MTNISIPVYSQEIKDGIADKVKASASIAYCIKPELVEPSDEWVTKASEVLKSGRFKALSSVTDSDLFFVKSILVSTNWNKNDDVFDKEEVWASRHTPSHKPDNLNHDEKLIIGHMVDVWPLDLDGNIIAEDTPIDKLPDLFHLANGSVIYTTWSDNDFRQQVMDLIEKLKAGEGFVSMECLFRGFDYAVKTPNDEFKILARNQETSFLTKHLRCYGGTGEYQDHKVGRLLRRITFSGKGYVDKPANENSIVFSQENGVS